MSIAQIAAKTTPTHGAIAGHSEMNVTGAGPGFGLHIVDVEVDRETGRVDIKRYTVVEDAGKAIHPLDKPYLVREPRKGKASFSRALHSAARRFSSLAPLAGRGSG